MRSAAAAALAFAACLALAGCGGGSSSNPVIAITPYKTSVAEGGTVTFTAQTANTSSSAVAWSIEEGPACGTITAYGVYTAPMTTGTFHVLARSASNSSAFATATVKVTAGS